MNEKKKLSIDIIFKSSEKLYKKNEKDSLEDRLFLWRIIINSIFSLILIATFCLMWTSYSPVWKIFFFLTIWSFWSNTFYIISITITDILIYKGFKKCEKFNLFIRNDLVRILVPFSISTIIIYWELVLLGDKFQGIGHSILDICKSFFMHGLVLIFISFDLFTSKHINKKNNCKIDLIIITIIMIIHYSLVILCKEVFSINQYDFLIIADKRQTIASFIIIYGIMLNGYVAFYLISDNFFENEEIKEKDNLLYLDEESGDKLNKFNDEDYKDEKIFNDNNKENDEKLNEKRDSINNNYLESEDEEKNKSNENNIKEEDKNDYLSEDKRDDIISDKQKEENNIDEISEKVSNLSEIKRKTLDSKKDNENDNIKINSFNQKNNLSLGKGLLNLKKTKFGIKNIKIPKNE